MQVYVTPTLQNLVQFIKLRLKRLGISQRTAAEHAEIDPGTLSNIMIGRVTKSPAIETLEALGKGLRVDPELLIAIVRGKVGTTDDEIAQLAQDGKEPGRGAQLAAELGLHTGGNMSAIRHNRPPIDWATDDPAVEDDGELPWVGFVSCGRPLDDPAAARRVRVPARYVGPQRFVVTATGDSLNTLGPPLRAIVEGDGLVVRPIRHLEHGDVVVAYVPGEGAVAKVYWHTGRGSVLLRPWSDNPEHQSIPMADEIKIKGKVIAVLPAPRELEGDEG